MQRMTILLMVSLLYVVPGLAADAKGTEAGAKLFAKQLSDGSKLLLDWQRLSESTMKGTGTGRVPAVKVSVTLYRLTKVTDEHKETVWEKKVTTGLPSGVYLPFLLNDAELIDGKLYILYAMDGIVRLDAVVRQESGDWTSVMSERMKDRPRSPHPGHLFRDSGKIGIKFIDDNAREEIWEIRDGAIRKRPPTVQRNTNLKPDAQRKEKSLE